MVSAMWRTGYAALLAVHARPRGDDHLGTAGQVRGVIGARWEVSSGRLTYRVELPPGVTATVRMPGRDGGPETVHAAGPGTHEFTGPLGA